MNLSYVRKIVLGVAVVAVVAGCGAKGDKVATQVAAKVDGNEISIHQINFLLQRTNVAPAQVDTVKGQALERLIDQEVVVKKATEKKLDRDPQVMQQIEEAKREILERAYLQQVAADVPKPTDQEIKDYYTQHPELFSQRRVFNFRVLTVQAPKEKFPALQEQVSKAKTLEDLVPWLKEQNLPATANAVTRAAEQIPLEVLPKFQQMKDGQIGVNANANGIEIMQLASSRTEPVDEAHAKPVIEQFLTNSRGRERAQKEVKDLRATAKIEYVGEFANKGATQSAPAAVAPSAAASAPAQSELE
ncbi:MAG TPA: EpsD family peptidyl-prolyl cis-trans isomerase, partial [Rhodocyclaceae bacterium]|nr:EpsD family peptidyl-prolyl cis-trans isomerase [Rhodocyclaceae bacterium]